MAVKNFLLHFKCDSWMTQIPFCVSLTQLSNSPEELTFNEHSNILEFCNPSYKNMKVYFDPVKYPTVTKDNDSGFVALHKDLKVLALKDGFYMKSNGGSKCSNSRLFCCRCNRAYIHNTEDERGPYRISSLHYDALNFRGHDGWALSRWTRTMKPFLGEECCHFHFYVKWDSIGIYLHCGVGTGFHNSHPKNISDDMLFSYWLISQLFYARAFLQYPSQPTT
jgi:hypothetical protein